MFEMSASYRVQVRLILIIPAEDWPRGGAQIGAGAKRQGGGGFGAVLPRFGAFFGFFRAAGRKVENPLSRELNPRLPLYFAGGVTKIPGPRVCSDQGDPEPPWPKFGRIIRTSFLSATDLAFPGETPAGPRPSALRPRPYPRACKSGAYPRKKAGSAGIGLRPGPAAGKVSRRPATRLERPD